MQTLIEKYWRTAWNPLGRKENTRFVYIQGMRNHTIFMLRVIKVKTDAHKERGGSFAPLTVPLCLKKTQNEFLPAEVNSEDSPLSQKREFYSPIHFSSAFPALCQPLHCVTHPQCKGKYSCHAQIGGRREESISFSLKTVVWTCAAAHLSVGSAIQMRFAVDVWIWRLFCLKALTFIQESGMLINCSKNEYIQKNTAG